MKRFRNMVPVAVLAFAVGISGSLYTLQAEARELMGKVMAVYHEPVTVNNKVMDKVSVTVAACGNEKLETVSYSPGYVSDDNSLGYLYNHLAVAARTTSQKNQYMNSVGGHVTLALNDTSNVIQKTTFWAYNWECGRNLDAAGVAGQPATPATPPYAGAPPAKPQGGGGYIKNRFGF